MVGTGTFRSRCCWRCQQLDHCSDPEAKGLTDAGVAVVAEVESLPAVALVHVVMDVEADLCARVPIFAATWKEKQRHC